MDFKSELAEREIGEDYSGLEESFIDGDGVRRRVNREYDERESIRFLEELERNITIVKKEGDDNIMEYINLSLQELVETYLGAGVEKEFFEIESRLSESTRKALVGAIGILNKYKEEIAENPELKSSIITLVRFLGFGAGYSETEKGLRKGEPVDWLTVRTQLFGELLEPDEVEVEKSDVNKDDPFPSISRQIKRNKEIIEETIEENNEGEGFLQ